MTVHFLSLSNSYPTFPRWKNTCHDVTVPTPEPINTLARFFSLTVKMIVTQFVLAFCVGFSLAQKVSEKNDAIGLDGKDGAGLENSE